MYPHFYNRTVLDQEWFVRKYGNKKLIISIHILTEKNKFIVFQM